MSLRFSDLELLALIACGLTTWLLVGRGRMAPENNWPLVYYLGMVFYQKTGGGFLDANFLYAGVVCAMIIRFEFMSPAVVKLFRFIEGICLVYIVWRCLEFVLFR
ncbi:MAG TPA: hypothetical protein VFQ91_11400 [Bryobacteraceae bacterium]|nr:hypothetical protein [Bryobacteraceae bacterium]